MRRSWVRFGGGGYDDDGGFGGGGYGDDDDADDDGGGDFVCKCFSLPTHQIIEERKH